MFYLKQGEYTGKTVHKIEIEGNFISATCYSATQSKKGWHFHQNPHLCFVFEGFGDSQTSYSAKKNIKLRDIFYYPAGEKHRWISKSPITKSANVEINPEFLQKYDLHETKIYQSLIKNPDAKMLMLKIQREVLNNDRESFMAIQLLLLELLSSPQISAKTQPKWVQILKELLNDRWDEKITLTELAQVTNVHPVTISKYFRKYFNCTLGQYQRKIKITKSLSLIKNQNYSLTEIAFKCGFADQSHFNRNFKKFTTFSPKEFRNL